ncbi:MAG TPA: CDP-diacylglycerol--glycerol-3-phosphate 3-phosphatidyltransferase [Candidatus Scybalocola faecavium]|nr:CDP-diacylglycerol--glycerol-3-phosphate 3-phosphatidyltransferase [Candidatus Scybalocola faecavium]
MNLPNKLTLLRVILIPFFVVFLLGADTFGSWSVYVALAIFIIASLTDMLDGKIARKYNLVTNFGKFMDPLADKLLVVSALVCYVDMGRIPSWIVLVIIAREFIISGFRLVAAESGIVIAASYWGKIKTTVQMITIIFMMPDFGGTVVYWIEQVLIWASLILTIVSLIDYIVKNKEVLLNGGKI